MIRVVVYALVIATSPGAVCAAGSSDAVVSSASETWVGNSPLHGWDSSLGWIHTLSAGQTASFGLDWMQFGAFTRMLTQVGGSTPLTSRLALDGQVRLGEANEAGDRYLHGELMTELSYRTSPQTLVSAEQRAITAGSLHGELLGVSATYLATSSVSLRASTLATVGGDLGTRASSLRVDYIRRIHLLAGVCVGESQPGISSAPLVNSGHQVQYYAGFGSQIRWVSLTLILDRFHSDTVNQYDAMLIASTPLPGSR
jgi:hypothetical protein